MDKLSHDFLDIEYLKAGTKKQREAYKIIRELNILEKLYMYNPVLAGTIPIEIDLPESDLDIICEVHDFQVFRELMNTEYGSYEDFDCRIRDVDGIPRIVSNFTYKGWMFEVFGQPMPTTEQNAYKHMVIEHRILNSLGDKAKEMILELKQNKLKTEPAFGTLLRMDKAPYMFLLEMYDWSDKELEKYLRLAEFLNI